MAITCVDKLTPADLGVRRAPVLGAAHLISPHLSLTTVNATPVSWQRSEGKDLEIRDISLNCCPLVLSDKRDIAPLQRIIWPPGKPPWASRTLKKPMQERFCL